MKRYYFFCLYLIGTHITCYAAKVTLSFERLPVNQLCWFTITHINNKPLNTGSLKATTKALQRLEQEDTKDFVLKRTEQLSPESSQHIITTYAISCPTEGTLVIDVDDILAGNSTPVWSITNSTRKEVTLTYR